MATSVKAAVRSPASTHRCELYYNEVQHLAAGQRDGHLRMVKMLKAEGIRIDGIGMRDTGDSTYPERESTRVGDRRVRGSGRKVRLPSSTSTSCR